MFQVESLFQAFLTFIVDIVFFIGRIFVVAIFSPVIALFGLIVPSIDYLNYTNDFLSKILNGIGFAKEVFLNVTGFPRALFTALITFFFARFLLTSTIRLYVFIKNMWRLIKKGD